MPVCAMSGSGYTETDNTANEEIVSLDGKTVFVVGNSVVYYGNCVIHGNQGESDAGYFYQLASSNGEETTVIDHTYPGKTLEYIYENYLSNLSAQELAKADYVVLSEATKGNADLASDCEKIMALFPETAEFYFLCHPIMYENATATVDAVSNIRSMGITIVDWGQMVYDIYTGATEVPGATLTFDRCSFLKDNVGYPNGDKKHPNPLSGYITAQMLYSAITNRSAVYQDYSFCSDSSISTHFDFDEFIKTHYNGDKPTNFDKIFASPKDMIGIQTLIDEYNEKEGQHAIVIAESVAPTCTRAGLTAGYSCSVCKEVFEEQQMLPSLGGHKIIYDNAYEPTCTKAGKTQGAHCSVCGEVIVAQKEIAATTHTTKVTVTPATLSAAGKIVTSCTVCKKTVSTVKIRRIKSVTLSSASYTYNAKQKTPSVTITDWEGTNLKKGTDYTVKYVQSQRINPGTYEVKVTFKGNYEGSKSLYFTIAPKAPENIKASATASSVTLSWKKVTGATGYVVYKYNPSTKKYTQVKSTTSTKLTIKNLKSATKYYYAVKASKKSGSVYIRSKYSSVLTVSTKPSTPVLKVTAGTAMATLSWDKVSRATGYVVYMSTSKNGTYEKIGTTKGSTVKFVKTNLKSGKTYYFKVRAYTKNGSTVYSSYSAVKSVKVK